MGGEITQHVESLLKLWLTIGEAGDVLAIGGPKCTSG